jgi:hypothetical protein
MAQRGMHRTRAAAAPPTTAVGAATDALVAPLLQLTLAANDAYGRLRLPRALELYERALALAEKTAPESTLLIVMLLEKILDSRMNLAIGGNASVTEDLKALAALHIAAWRDDLQLLRLSQRRLGLLRARWAAGTLLTPTPEEAHFSDKLSPRTSETLGMVLFVSWAGEAIQNWPCTLLTPADDVERLHGVHEALCAVLTMQPLTLERAVYLDLPTVDAIYFVLHNACTERHAFAAPLARDVRPVAR